MPLEALRSPFDIDSNLLFNVGFNRIIHEVQFEVFHVIFEIGFNIVLNLGFICCSIWDFIPH